MAVPSTHDARNYYRVAIQRFEDAAFLLSVKRTTAAVYLVGYSVERMLKSLILAQIPAARVQEILESFRGVRGHNFDWLLRLYYDEGGPPLSRQTVQLFTRVNTWSTATRYFPGSVKFRDASDFLGSVEQIIDWADGRLS